MELTGTNRPKAYIIVIFVLCVCVHCTVLRQQAILCGGNPRKEGRLQQVKDPSGSFSV